MIELLIIVTAVGFVVVAHRLTRGMSCSGDCEQGRKPCNCRNKWEK